jgi:hypothetical protein
MATSSKECTPLSTDAPPNHLTLTLLHSELNDYAASVITNLGGGTEGHLFLTLTDTEWQAIPHVPHPFVPPVHPGPPVHQPGATQHQIIETNRLNQEALTDYKLYHSTEQILKQMLIKAVPNQYISALRDPRMGYRNATTKQLLQHLDEKYGQISAQDIKRNLLKMNSPWNPTQAIDTLWTQIREARMYAQDRSPIDDITAINSAMDNIKATGLFASHIEHWSLLEPEAQTWARFQKLFTMADNTRRTDQTTAGAGYTATTEPTNDPTAFKATPNNGEPSIHIVSSDGNATHWFYCWTHGINKSHHSKTCTRQKEGHNASATMNNRKGGATTIHIPLRRNARPNANMAPSNTTPSA